MTAVPAGWDGRLTIECVLAGQGIDPRSRSPLMPALVAAARTALARAPALLKPAVGTRLLAVLAHDASGLVLDGGARIEGDGAARHLAGATRVLLGVCTIGPDLDRESATLLPTNPVVALALDGLGCAAVEALAAAVQNEARSAALLDGCEASTRLSPGGEGWPLEAGQRTIFAALGGGGAGVRLGESGQMWPVKSVSFALGLGRDVRHDETAECEGCGARERCRWRMAREVRGGL